MIPLSGPRTEHQDYYSVMLRYRGGGEPDLLVGKSGKKGVVGKEWAGESFSIPKNIPWSDLEECKIETSHYLKGHEFRYDSAFSLLWREALFLPKLAIWGRETRQKFYNSRTPVRTSRIDLLKLLIEHRVDYHAQNNNYSLHNEKGDSIVDILKAIYGIRIYLHPRKDAYRAQLLVDLDSLVATNDVSMVDRNYVATGKAVATIATYEEENRRHIDNKKHNNRILWLTVALVLIGLLQVPKFQDFLGIGAAP